MLEVSTTLEDYLEAILQFEEKKGITRVKDLAQKLKVKPPTVNAAIKRLHDESLVEHETYGYIKLTDKGRIIALQVLKKHQLLVKFLVHILGIRECDAVDQACGMEHSMCTETQFKFERLTQFFETNPEIFEKWIIERVGNG